MGGSRRLRPVLGNGEDMVCLWEEEIGAGDVRLGGSMDWEFGDQRLRRFKTTDAFPYCNRGRWSSEMV